MAMVDDQNRADEMSRRSGKWEVGNTRSGKWETGSGKWVVREVGSGKWEVREERSKQREKWKVGSRGS